MNKKILSITLSLITLTFVSCGTQKTPPNSSSASVKSSSNISIQSSDTNEDLNTPLTLTKSASYPCPFVFSGNNLIFPNPNENNKITSIPNPSTKDILQSKDITDFANYSADNIALINDKIYFGNGSDENALCSLNLSDKSFTKLTQHSVHNLISVENTLYYTNKNDDNRLYSYDTKTSNANRICSDDVGIFIITGDFIIYQNLSDNSKLYSIKTDGTNKQKLTDYTANSFMPYEGQLLFFNSSDNNNLYALDPSKPTCKRLYVMNGYQLKLINNSLYFINGDDSNNLYSLTVDITNTKVTFKPEISEGITEYYLTPKGIFYSASININSIYYKDLSTKS